MDSELEEGEIPSPPPPSAYEKIDYYDVVSDDSGIFHRRKKRKKPRIHRRRDRRREESYEVTEVMKDFDRSRQKLLILLKAKQANAVVGDCKEIPATDITEVEMQDVSEAIIIDDDDDDDDDDDCDDLEQLRVNALHSQTRLTTNTDKSGDVDDEPANEFQLRAEALKTAIMKKRHTLLSKKVNVKLERLKKVNGKTETCDKSNNSGDLNNVGKENIDQEHHIKENRKRRRSKRRSTSQSERGESTLKFGHFNTEVLAPKDSPDSPEQGPIDDNGCDISFITEVPEGQEMNHLPVPIPASPNDVLLLTEVFNKGPVPDTEGPAAQEIHHLHISTVPIPTSPNDVVVLPSVSNKAIGPLAEDVDEDELRALLLNEIKTKRSANNSPLPEISIRCSELSDDASENLVTNEKTELDHGFNEVKIVHNVLDCASSGKQTEIQSNISGIVKQILKSKDVSKTGKKDCPVINGKFALDGNVNLDNITETMCSTIKKTLAKPMKNPKKTVHTSNRLVKLAAAKPDVQAKLTVTVNIENSVQPSKSTVPKSKTVPDKNLNLFTAVKVVVPNEKLSNMKGIDSNVPFKKSKTVPDQNLDHFTAVKVVVPNEKLSNMKGIDSKVPFKKSKTVPDQNLDHFTAVKVVVPNEKLSNMKGIDSNVPFKKSKTVPDQNLDNFTAVKVVVPNEKLSNMKRIVTKVPFKKSKTVPDKNLNHFTAVKVVEKLSNMKRNDSKVPFKKSLPAVTKRLVIPLRDDSSEDDMEPNSKVSAKVSASLDEFLENARRLSDKSDPTTPATPEAVHAHLPPSQRIEYMRLKQKLFDAEKEKTKNKALASTSKPPLGVNPVQKSLNLSPTSSDVKLTEDSKEAPNLGLNNSSEASLAVADTLKLDEINNVKTYSFASTIAIKTDITAQKAVDKISAVKPHPPLGVQKLVSTTSSHLKLSEDSKKAPNLGLGNSNEASLAAADALKVDEIKNVKTNSFASTIAIKTDKTAPKAVDKTTAVKPYPNTELLSTNLSSNEFIRKEGAVGQQVVATATRTVGPTPNSTSHIKTSMPSQKFKSPLTKVNRNLHTKRLSSASKSVSTPTKKQNWNPMNGVVNRIVSDFDLLKKEVALEKITRNEIKRLKAQVIALERKRQGHQTRMELLSGRVYRMLAAVEKNDGTAHATKAPDSKIDDAPNESKQTLVTTTILKAVESSNLLSYSSPLNPATSAESKLDPYRELCPHDLSGVCRDPECIYQHTKGNAN